MKPRRISDLKSSIESARDKFEDCRTKRVIFEQRMDQNSCEEHSALVRLYETEKKLGSDLELAENRLFEARRRFRFQAIAVLGILVGAGFSIAYLVYTSWPS
jgi:hypothetical protein